MKGSYKLNIRLRHDIQRAGSGDLYEVLNYLIRQGHKGLGAEDIEAIGGYLKNLKILENKSMEVLNEPKKSE